VLAQVPVAAKDLPVARVAIANYYRGGLTIAAAVRVARSVDLSPFPDDDEEKWKELDRRMLAFVQRSLQSPLALADAVDQQARRDAIWRTVFYLIVGALVCWLVIWDSSMRH